MNPKLKTLNPKPLPPNPLPRSDWAEATRLILCPRLGEKDEATNARKKWEEDGNIEQALRTFPHWMHVERSLLEGFKRHGKDSHKEALNCVTRNMRLMYVHAWQSGVFNRMASERVERYTLDPKH